MDIVALFYDLDKFAQEYTPHWHRRRLASGRRIRRRAGRMYLSEVMTILVLFHLSNYRDFKHFYCDHVKVHRAGEFPRLVSYSRFIELVPGALAALICFLQTRMGKCTGISFVDSTSLCVCHHLRIASHRVMAGLAQRGKTSVGWFFGFKLHLVTNERGELLSVCLTAGNVDDRQPVDQLTQALWGKLCGDRGYISQPLFARLFNRGVHLVTRLKAKMKNRLMPWLDKLLLRKRAVIETIIDQLKNICQIEHSRHRGVPHYFADIVAALVAYTFREHLPAIDLSYPQQRALEITL